MDVPQYPLDAFAHIARVSSPDVAAANVDPDSIPADVPPRFFTLLNQRPRWKQHWQCDPNALRDDSRKSVSEHAVCLMIFCGEAGFSNEEGTAILRALYAIWTGKIPPGKNPPEPTQPLIPGSPKEKRTVDKMQIGRDLAKRNPGPTTTEGGTSPSGTAGPQNEQDTPTEVTVIPPVDELPQNEQPPDDEEPDDRLPEFPLHTLTGIAGEIATAYAEILEAPPQFFFFDLLTIVGLMICKFIRMDTLLLEAPRLYTIKVARSWSSRKSHSQKVTDDLTRKFVEPDRIGRLYGVGSDIGLAHTVKEGLPVLLIFDEFRAFVNKASMSNQNLLSMVTTLFHSTRYENRTKDKHLKIDEGHIAIVGACTKETFVRMFTPEFYDMGSLNRFFLVGGSRTHLRPLPMLLDPIIENRFAQHLERVIVGLERKVMTTIPFDADALHAWEELYRWVHDKAKISRDAARLDSYGLRLLQLYAVITETYRVTRAHVGMIESLLLYQYDLRRALAPIDAETTQARLEQLILRNLTRIWITESRLYKYTNAKRFDRHMWRRCLQYLEAELLIEKKEGTRKDSNFLRLTETGERLKEGL